MQLENGVGESRATLICKRIDFDLSLACVSTNVGSGFGTSGDKGLALLLGSSFCCEFACVIDGYYPTKMYFRT